MILGEVILVGLVLSLVTGGSLRRLSREHLRGEYALIVLLPAQVLWPRASEALDLSCQISIGVWLAMMFGLVLVLLFNAGRRWPLYLSALGIAANIAVIVANGAMPVDMKASSEVGFTRSDARAVLSRDCLHEELTQGSRLPPLSDTIPIPGPPWQRSVVSVGDLLLGVGLAGWIFMASRKSSPE